MIFYFKKYIYAHTESPHFNKTSKNFKEQMLSLFCDKLLAANTLSSYSYFYHLFKTQPVFVLVLR